MGVRDADGADARLRRAPPPPTPPRGEGSLLFCVAASRLAALAAQFLGWRPHEFWAATPGELALSLGAPEPSEAPPSREEILAMIEREANDRSD